MQSVISHILQLLQSGDFWFYLSSCCFGAIAGYNRARARFGKHKKNETALLEAPAIQVQEKSSDEAETDNKEELSEDEEMRLQLETLLEEVLHDNRRLRARLSKYEKNEDGG